MKQLPSVSHQSLLFDYVSFCRSINVNIMKSIISVGSSSASNRLFLQQEFYNLFMKKCSELKYLDMRSIEHQIFNFPEAKLRFESLYELKCDTSIDSSYFYGLAHISQYIQKIIVVNNAKTKANFGVVKLIEVQKNLKYFELIDDHYIYAPGPDRDSYKEILLALEKNANIITHLNIYFIFISRTSPNVFPKFLKLKTLITGFGFSFSKEQLKMCVYRELEIFKIDYYDLKAASIIIENSGGRLKKIFLGSSYELDDYISDFDDDSLIFIRRVYENCLSIEHLSLVFPPSEQHFDEFEKLLKTCQNLKSLLLVIYMNEVEIEEEILFENGEELLKILIKSAPINLREIRFLYDVKFSLESLEEFLEKWRGRPALSIFTCRSIYKEENYVRLINKYKDNRIIKDFRCESFDNVVNENFKM
uniref:F-box domain-containing protein n=1 Tax=Rhizophagus irregularis (strain DAOM 181602 / DAOM 197198 / MUCL 43194) TaxID=747089 RepID=U9UKN5_RHIID